MAKLAITTRYYRNVSLYIGRLCLMCIPFYLSLSAQAESITAPDFEVAGLESNIKLSDYKGKTVYLDFWASWCGPCAQSFPWMQQMHNKYQSQGLVIIAMNLDQERKLANDFLQQHLVDFIIGFDESGETPSSYQVQGMPSAVIIDKSGHIVSRHIGFNSTQQHEYEAAIQAALKASKN